MLINPVSSVVRSVGPSFVRSFGRSVGPSFVRSFVRSVGRSVGSDSVLLAEYGSIMA